MSNGEIPDPDDYFKDTRMSFADHIGELSVHLWRAVYGFLFALLASFFVGHIVMDWITAPVKAQLEAFYNRRLVKQLSDKGAVAERVNQVTQFHEYLFSREQMEALVAGKAVPNRRPVPLTADEEYWEKNPPGWFDRLVRGVKPPDQNPFRADAPPDQPKFSFPLEEIDRHTVSLWVAVRHPKYVGGELSPALRDLFELDKPTTLNATEGFFVWFKVCLMCGLVLGSPWIFWQIWMFVAAGLYEHEKKLVHVYLPVSVFLFITGVVMCQIFVIPKALEALLWFNEWLGFRPDMRLNEWLSFAIYMPVVFGISFQTPLVMMFLHKLRIVTADTFRGHRRMAWFIMAIFAAIITPSTDALSMLFLWVPMSLLFELGIVLIAMSPQPLEEEEPAESDELVEV